ncbi:hypothetical protein ACSIGC_08465 [Tenacibaculum sp. ZS6-P6]|uniref:hypothetical protein n=1 Tax=Tenacibaculum sp. ZS6-P6 TaxID=3447503 RepID=UPI003F99C81D
MALIILDSTKCSLCNKTLKADDEIISWSAFLIPDHKFGEFSDSGMHKSCFENWEHKDEFQYLHSYKPYFDFNDSHIKTMIEKHGMPDRLKEVQAFRKKHPEFKP